MQSQAKTVDAYLASLPEDRRQALKSVRAVIRKNLPKGYEEGIQYGMIGYYVPHSIYPDGYHCDPKQPVPFVGLASQKNYMSLYMMCIYGAGDQEAWFRKAWAATGKKLDMGKSCVRFKRVEDLPLAVIGEAIKRVPVKRFLDHYDSVVKSMGKRASRSTAKKSAPAKSTRKSTGAAKKNSPTRKTASAKKGTAKTKNRAAAKRKA